MMQVLIEQGLAEGLAKGLAEGLTKGRAEGAAEGRAEGAAEGRAEGAAEGKRVSLRAFVEGRFGAIPDALEQRIAAADSATLDALIARVARAQDAAELLG